MNSSRNWKIHSWDFFMIWFLKKICGIDVCCKYRKITESRRVRFSLLCYSKWSYSLANFWSTINQIISNAGLAVAWQFGLSASRKMHPTCIGRFHVCARIILLKYREALTRPSSVTLFVVSTKSANINLALASICSWVEKPPSSISFLQEKHSWNHFKQYDEYCHISL